MVSNVAPNDGDAQTALLSGASSQTSYDTLNDPERRDEAIAKPAPSDVEADVLPETSTLGRSLSWRSAYILTISRVLGSGIFATPGTILAAVGSPGLALSLWVAGSFIAFFGLTVALEYGCMLPRSGGDKVWLEFTYRRPKYLASVLVATKAILLGFTASNAIVFARYLLFALGIEGSEVWVKTIAVVLLTWITVVHACFRETGVRIQDFLGWVKVILIAFLMLSGLVVVAFRALSPNDDASRLSEATNDYGPLTTAHSIWDGSVWSLGVIAPSLFKVFYSFAGLENVTNVLNEVKNPVQTLRSVTLTALLTAVALYLLINVAFFLVVPLDEVKSSGELIAALFFEKVFGDTFGRRILPIMVALSGMGNVMVVTFALARLNQEIARTGLIPFSRILSSTAPFGSPIGGLIVHYIPSVLVITIPSGDIYSFILEVEGYPSQFFSVAVCVGLLILRFKRPDLKRPYKAFTPGVIIHIALSFVLIAAPFFPSEAQKSRGRVWSAAYAIVGISIIGVGVLYWFLWTIALPKWQGYKLEDRTEVLDDGTTVTRLARIPISPQATD